MALLEAMAAGRAGVATRAGGSSELVEAEVDGLLVPVEDPDAMTAALLRLISGAVLRDRLGAAARKKVGQHFSRDRMIDQTIACYHRLVRQVQ